MRLVLYFTYQNASLYHRKIKHGKVRCAFTTVFYSSKCDRVKPQTRNLDSKRECVKTLAPADESDVSHVEGALQRSENSQSS